MKALRSSNYVTLSQTANDVTVATTTALQTALDGKANASGATFSGIINIQSLSCVLPANVGGAAQIVCHKYSDKSGSGEVGAHWSLGRGAQSVGANSFAIGANILGSALTF